MVNQITSQYTQVYAVKQNVSSQKQQATDTFKSILNDATQNFQGLQTSGKDKSEDIKSGTGKNNSDKDSGSNVKNKQAGVQEQAQSAAANADASAQVQTPVEATGNGSVSQLQGTKIIASAALSSGTNNSTGTSQSKNNAAVDENTAQQKQLLTAKTITEETSSQTVQKAQASSENAKTSNLSGQLKQDVSALGTGQQKNKTGSASTNTAQQLSQNSGTAQTIDIKSSQQTSDESNSNSSMSDSGKENNTFSLKSDAKSGSGNDSTNISQLSSSAQQSANLYTDGNIVVKVADAPAKTKVPAFRQVADSITTNLNNGKHEFQVNLYPQSLGKVSVKLTSESGMLTVVIAASNPKTQSLLASNSGDIKSILQASTGQQNVQVVNQSQQDSAAWYDGNQQSGGGYSGNQQNNQQQQRQNSQNQHIQEIYGVSGTSFSTGDFLTMMSNAAAGSF